MKFYGYAGKSCFYRVLYKKKLVYIDSNLNLVQKPLNSRFMFDSLQTLQSLRNLLYLASMSGLDDIKIVGVFSGETPKDIPPVAFYFKNIDVFYNYLVHSKNKGFLSCKLVLSKCSTKEEVVDNNGTTLYSKDLLKVSNKFIDSYLHLEDSMFDSRNISNYYENNGVSPYEVLDFSTNKVLKVRYIDAILQECTDDTKFKIKLGIMVSLLQDLSLIRVTADKFGVFPSDVSLISEYISYEKLLNFDKYEFNEFISTKFNSIYMSSTLLPLKKIYRDLIRDTLLFNNAHFTFLLIKYGKKSKGRLKVSTNPCKDNLADTSIDYTTNLVKSVSEGLVKIPEESKISYTWGILSKLSSSSLNISSLSILDFKKSLELDKNIFLTTGLLEKRDYSLSSFLSLINDNTITDNVLVSEGVVSLNKTPLSNYILLDVSVLTPKRISNIFKSLATLLGSISDNKDRPDNSRLLRFYWLLDYWGIPKDKLSILNDFALSTALIYDKNSIYVAFGSRLALRTLLRSQTYLAYSDKQIETYVVKFIREWRNSFKERNGGFSLSDRDLEITLVNKGELSISQLNNIVNVPRDRCIIYIMYYPYINTIKIGRSEAFKQRLFSEGYVNKKLSSDHTLRYLIAYWETPYHEDFNVYKYLMFCSEDILKDYFISSSGLVSNLEYGNEFYTLPDSANLLQAIRDFSSYYSSKSLKDILSVRGTSGVSKYISGVSSKNKDNLRDKDRFISLIKKL